MSLDGNEHWAVGNRSRNGTVWIVLWTWEISFRRRIGLEWNGMVWSGCEMGECMSTSERLVMGS